MRVKVLEGSERKQMLPYLGVQYHWWKIRLWHEPVIFGSFLGTNYNGLARLYIKGSSFLKGR